MSLMQDAPICKLDVLSDQLDDAVRQIINAERDRRPAQQCTSSMSGARQGASPANSR